MTLSEYLLEADFNYRQSPEGRHAAKRDDWAADSELSDDEWWAKHGATKD